VDTGHFLFFFQEQNVDALQLAKQLKVFSDMFLQLHNHRHTSIWQTAIK